MLNSIKKDFNKIKKDFCKEQRFCDKQEYIKVKLTDNYCYKKYTEKELLKRLQYLRNGISLDQSFYISFFISVVFFALSIFLPSMMQSAFDHEGRISQHQYFLQNNEYYAQGYNMGLEQKENDGDYVIHQSFDNWEKVQIKMFENGYNYAMNDGYDFNYVSLKTTVYIIIAYLMVIVAAYAWQLSRQNSFNEYLTNDFEIELILKKLGVIKNCTKQYRVTIKSQGQDARVFSVELKM